MGERDQPLIPLGEIVEQFATAMHAADKRGPRAVNPGSKCAYHPGIGPHPEHQAVDLVMRELALQRPAWRWRVGLFATPRCCCLTNRSRRSMR